VFDDPIIWAGHYAEHLRTNEDVDVVLAVIHGRSDYTNSQIAALSGNNKIDAIFNGHTHSRYTQTISRDGLDVPVIQSKANGEYVVRVSLTVSNGSVIDFSLTNLHPTQSSSTASDHITRDSRLATSQTEVQAIINEYKLAIDSLLNEVILTSSSYYSKNDLTNYMAALIRLSVNADIGIHNYGGTRTELSQNQAITVATLYEIFPFDNRVKYVYLSGSDIKDYANSYDALSFKDGLSLSTLKNDVYYKVATNDYIFDKLDNPFIHGVDPVDTGILIRDLLETVLREQAKYYSTFSMDRPIVLTPVSYHVTREEDIA
jgi:2',3'-cyclic-nucleotide 2'-phosphodiesterase (5'-nucleotidase family)